MSRAKATRIKAQRRSTAAPKKSVTQELIDYIDASAAFDILPRVTLSERELAKCIERGIDPAKYSRIKSESLAWHSRRVGEGDSAYDRRRRHHVALGFVRWLERNLVRLARVARSTTFVEAAWETPENVDAWLLDRLLDCVDSAVAEWAHSDDGNDAPRRAIALRRALEMGRSKPSAPVDLVRDEVCVFEPELRRIPLLEWAEAIREFKGIRRGNKGGGWDVIFRLLEKHRLTNASSAEAMADGVRKYQKLRRSGERRASRAK